MIFFTLIGLHLYRSDGFRQFTIYNMSKTIIIKRAREARTFNCTGRFCRKATESSRAKNERIQYKYNLKLIYIFLYNLLVQNKSQKK